MDGFKEGDKVRYTGAYWDGGGKDWVGEVERFDPTEGLVYVLWLDGPERPPSYAVYPGNITPWGPWHELIEAGS